MAATLAVDVLNNDLALLDTAPAVAHAAAGRLRDLDLSMVRMKLADPKEGKGWADRELNLAEREYRRFLVLSLASPQASTVPCGLVDEVWHAHILDTMAYQADCERIFGFFFHHFPYFGMRSAEDAQDLSGAYDDTLVRYEEAFGTPPDGVWRPEQAMTCSRTNCKPQKCRSH